MLLRRVQVLHLKSWAHSHSSRLSALDWHWRRRNDLYHLQHHEFLHRGGSEAEVAQVAQREAPLMAPELAVGEHDAEVFIVGARSNARPVGPAAEIGVGQRFFAGLVAAHGNDRLALKIRPFFKFLRFHTEWKCSFPLKSKEYQAWSKFSPLTKSWRKLMWMLSNLFFQSSLEKVSIKGTNYPDNPNLALQQVELV